MAYFQQRDRDDAPAVRQEDLYEDEYLDDEYDEYDDEDYDEEYLTEEEMRDLRRYRFRMAAGLMDFLSVVVGTVVILLLVALLVNIITWLQGDLDQMFTLLKRNL